MEWQHPEWLYLILPLAAAWLALALYSRRRRRRAAEAFVAQAMWSRILPVDSRARFWAKLLLREIAIVTALAALAGPRFGTLYEDVIPRGADLYVLIDVSRSMLAQDVPPSRLGRAKADVAALVNRLDGERVGLIAFAGQAVVKCPLTVDYDAFRRSLDELDPNSAPRRYSHWRRNSQGRRGLPSQGQPRSGHPADHRWRRSAVLSARSRGFSERAPRHRLHRGPGRFRSSAHGSPRAQNRSPTSNTRVSKSGASSTARSSRKSRSRPRASMSPSAPAPTTWVSSTPSTSTVDAAAKTKASKRIRAQSSSRFSSHCPAGASGRCSSPEPIPPRKCVPSRPRHFAPHAQSRPSKPLKQPCQWVRRFSWQLRSAEPVEPTVPPTLFAQACARTARANLKKPPTASRQHESSSKKRMPTRLPSLLSTRPAALHRKGDVAQAREWYLKAGLAHDKGLAASAHFNLGTLSAEEARRLAGEKPEEVAPRSARRFSTS